MYKIVAKLLANRLKKVMSFIIDEGQSAFIEGRHLLQSAVIANEVVDEARRSQKPCIVFKVDFEKAYNSVSWNFLVYMLRRLGFCTRWFQWIVGCLKSASVSVLVNGSPSTEFSPKRGLRQGDPLTPFLFNIVAEALNGLVREVVKRKLYSGFHVGSNRVEVSILQYADYRERFQSSSWTWRIFARVSDWMQSLSCHDDQQPTTQGRISPKNSGLQPHKEKLIMFVPNMILIGDFISIAIFNRSILRRSLRINDVAFKMMTMFNPLNPK